MKIRALGVLVLLSLVLWVTLWRKSATTPQGAFYVWQTTWTLPDNASAPWRTGDFRKLYVRFFDVAYDQRLSKSVPVAPIEFVTPLPKDLEFIPVVYLVNDALAHETASSVSDLARHIYEKVAVMSAAQHRQFAELQIDCDWTESTRNRYFALLNQLKIVAKESRHSVTLSATIRLHQIKYPQRTGVPPVDRGMLMFYNMGTLRAESPRSSIFNAVDASRYTKFIAGYALPLDVVLPLFQWGVQERGGRAITLINGLNATDFAAEAMFHATGSDAMATTTAGFFHGYYFRQGDKIRFETVTPEVARAAANLVAQSQSRQHPFQTVAFFDLTERNLARYDASFFQQTLTAFR